MRGVGYTYQEGQKGIVNRCEQAAPLLPTYHPEHGPCFVLLQ
jgi:hypothetical protein